MEDLIGLVVVILYCVIAYVAGKKKKKRSANQLKKARCAAMEKAFEQAFSSMQDQRTGEDTMSMEQEQMPPELAQEGEGALFSEPEQMALEFAQEGEDPCHSDMLGEERPAMRAVNVSQATLAQVAEGEDPCHIGGTNDTDKPNSAYTSEVSPLFDTDDREALAQDILRGVIMSEILARPCERRVIAQRKRGT